MKRISLMLSLMMVAIGLAGCSGDGGSDEETSTGPPSEDDLQDGKGAIAGLLLDDRFRPIDNGTVLVEQTGETVTSNANGEFFVLNLEPGTYRLRAEVPGHEALPVSATVEEGLFAEQRVVARRVVSDDGSIITREFSVFIPCAADFVVNGVTANCVLDLSGDSYRSGFTVNTTDMQNVTYLVTEMKANTVGNYNVQVREDDGSASGGERYAVGRIVDGDYIKMVNPLGVKNEEHNAQENNVPWNNTKPYATQLFLEGDYRDELAGASEPLDALEDVCAPGVVCLFNPICCGVGAQFGVKATFIQSIFIGEPEVDIDSYRTFR